MNTPYIVSTIAGWLFCIVVFAIGLVNTFGGNDPGLGITLLILSFVYFPPVNTLLQEKTGFSIHRTVKIVLGIVILWAWLGVGELFDKIELMMNDF